MRFKWPCISPTGLALQNWGFDLQEIALIQPAADAAHQLRAAAEGVAGIGRNDQIEVALAVALLHIRQAMPLIGQGLQAFTEHLPFGCLHRQLTAISAAQGALDPDPIAGVHQAGDLLERLSKCCFFEKQLNGTGLIGQGEKRQLAHHPARHHAASHSHRHIPLFAIGKIGVGLLQLSGAMAGLKAQGIRHLAALDQCLGFLQASITQLAHAQAPAALSSPRRWEAYPVPRTVRINSGLRGSGSSLPRRRATYTSTTRRSAVRLGG